LEVFNALRFEGLGVREFDDADGQVFQFCQLRRSQATDNTIAAQFA
jgi:hypothetical protein